MRNTTKQILILIDQYLNHKIKYVDFYGQFNDIVHKALDIDDKEAYLEWEINDRLALVGDDPIDSESRKYGYIGAEEFRVWLVDYKQKNSHFWK